MYDFIYRLWFGVDCKLDDCVHNSCTVLCKNTFKEPSLRESSLKKFAQKL